MIVTIPLTTDLTLGVNQSLQGLDSEVELPPTIVPIVPLLHVTINAGIPSATDEQRDSTLIGRSVIRGPSLAQLDTNVLTLAKGLWELDIELTNIADFAATPANAAMVEFQMIYQPSGVSHRLAVVPNIIGGNTHYVKHLFLLNTTALLFIRTPATIAAQNVTAILSLNAVRFL